MPPEPDGRPSSLARCGRPVLALILCIYLSALGAASTYYLLHVGERDSARLVVLIASSTYLCQIGLLWLVIRNRARVFRLAMAALYLVPSAIVAIQSIGR